MFGHYNNKLINRKLLTILYIFQAKMPNGSNSLIFNQILVTVSRHVMHHLILYIDLLHKSLPSGLGMDLPSPMDAVEMEDT